MVLQLQQQERYQQGYQAHWTVVQQEESSATLLIVACRCACCCCGEWVSCVRFSPMTTNPIIDISTTLLTVACCCFVRLQSGCPAFASAP
jgi:hypothetical protein